MLLLILAVGALLRLPGLWQFDAWQDEIYSIYEGARPDPLAVRAGWHGAPSSVLPGDASAGHDGAACHDAPAAPLPDLRPAGPLGNVDLHQAAPGRQRRDRGDRFLAVLPLHINASHIIRYWSLIYLLGVLYAGAVLRAIATDSRRDHLLALTWLLLGTLTHPTFAISAVGMTAAAHLVTNAGAFGLRLPSPAAWRLAWVPAVVLLLGYYIILWLFFTTERLVGEAAGSPDRLLPALAFNLSPAVMTASALGIVWLLWSQEAGLRRFGLMAVLGTLTSTATLLIGGYLHFLPVSVLYVAAAFPLLLGSAGALCRSFSATAAGERRAAVALLLVLAAALSPSTVSYLTDGARFDYRPALAHITTNDPRGTVVIWPRVQAMWSAPDLESIELRSTTPLSLFDSLSNTRDRFWVITSRRRYGIIGDADGRKQQWLVRHCDRVLTTGAPRFDSEQYIAMLWECRAGGPAPIHQSSGGRRALPDRD